MKEFIKRLLSSIIIVPIFIFFIIKGNYLFNLLLLFLFIISLYEWSKISINNTLFYLGFLFLILSFYSVYLLRNDFENYVPFLFITFICVLTDLGGYFFGKYFKGPKLIKISPKKTISGMFGSFFLSIIFSLTFIYISNKNLSNIDISFTLFIFIFLISFVSQVGDITVSFFKRKSNKKNSGSLIPGHGGLLDRIDGMIFAYPFAYLINSLSIFKIF